MRNKYAVAKTSLKYKYTKFFLDDIGKTTKTIRMPIAEYEKKIDDDGDDLLVIH